MHIARGTCAKYIPECYPDTILMLYITWVSQNYCPMKHVYYDTKAARSSSSVFEAHGTSILMFILVNLQLFSVREGIAAEALQPFKN